MGDRRDDDAPVNDEQTPPDPSPAVSRSAASGPGDAAPSPGRRLARLDAVPDGALVRCLHGGAAILLCRVGDEVHAVADACTHEDVSLSLGALSGHRLACPLHGAVFDVRTGAVLAEPARRALRTWPTRVVDGWIELVDD